MIDPGFEFKLAPLDTAEISKGGTVVVVLFTVSAGFLDGQWAVTGIVLIVAHYPTLEALDSSYIGRLLFVVSNLGCHSVTPSSGLGYSDPVFRVYIVPQGELILQENQ